MTQDTIPQPARDVDAFIDRWKASGGAEMANFQSFVNELCDLLGVARPEPTRELEADNRYVFEKAVEFRHGDGSTSGGRIDLYKEGCFVLEAKQGSGGDSAPPEPSVPTGSKRKRRLGTAVRGTRGWTQAMERAYGWPATLTDEEILERLVALNAERAEEEARGHVRWLRPDFQAPDEAQADLPGTAAPDTKATPAAKTPTPTKRLPWPKTLVDRVQAVRTALLAQPNPTTPDTLARTFKNARTDTVTEILETLVALGQAHPTPDGRFDA
ncbi:MAG: type IIL restriction-modification enzyme MmeI [Myxococcota bacterium]